MKKIERFKLSEKEKQEAIEFINEALFMFDTVGWDGYKVFRNSVHGRGTKIKNFFMLPKMAEHKRFREGICNEAILEEQEKETSKLLAIMNQNKHSFGEDHNLSKNEQDKLVYMRLKKQELIEGGNIVTIGLPFRKMVDNEYVNKFGKTMVIYENKTPKLYKDIVEKYRIFNPEEY